MGERVGQEIFERRVEFTAYNMAAGYIRVGSLI